MKGGFMAIRFNSFLVLLGLMGAVASFIHAAGRDVSLEMWLADALLRDPELAEALADSNWERSRAGAVSAWEDPEIRLGAEDREDRPDQKQIRLRVPVPNPWEARAERRRAKAEADVESERYEAMEWERRILLSTLYFESVYARQRLALRTELLEGLQEDLKDAEGGLELQSMSRTRVADMRAERAIAMARRAKDEVEWSTLKEDLRARAGWKADTIAGLSTPLPDLESARTLPPLEDLNRLATQDHGSLKALTAEQQMDKAELARERAQGIPWFTFLEGSWTTQTHREISDKRDRDDIQARIGVSLPVFTWLRGSQIEASFRVLRSRERINAQRTALESALQTARHHAEASLDRMLMTFESSSESLREIQDLLRTSEISPRVRANLRDLRFDLESERLEAALDYQLALLDLMMVTGPGFHF